MDDLWPDDIAINLSLRTPFAILRKQASALSEKTKNVVEGLVVIDSQASKPKGPIYYDFNIRAPMMNYTYQLFYISHPIELYPLRLCIEDEEVLSTWKGDPDNTTLQIETEDEFMQILRSVFASKRTRKIVSALIAQSMEIRGSDDL